MRLPGQSIWDGTFLTTPLQFESSERAALFRCMVIRLSRTGGRWPTAPDGRQPLPRRGPGTCCRRGGRGRGERLIEMCRARTGPRPGNVGVASAAYGRLKGEDTPCLQQRRQVDPSSRWQVSMLAEFGGAAGCSAAGWRRFSSAARRAGAPAAGARRLWEALLASSRSGRRLPAGEDVAVRILAREIASLDADIEELDPLVADSLAGDEVYECLLTVPGIGPKTAAALVTSIDISAFRGHDELASYCGVAPSDRRSGSSIRSTSPQHGGNRQLKNLLIFSCNSLIGTDNRFGRYYGECRARGMRHSKALKAVARKRLKVIYAIMRDAVPYAA